MHWHEIDGWFRWRSAQEEAVHRFPEKSCFVEVGTYLGRSLCSLGELVELSGKRIVLIGVDTCRGSGPEGPNGKDYHGQAAAQGGGTFAGTLHRRNRLASPGGAASSSWACAGPEPLLTRTLNLVGAQLSSRLLEPGLDNVTGYWESADLTALHDRVLESAGTSSEDS